MTPGLPLALRLVARFVPGDLREPITGDLAEEYLEMRARRGALRATWWLWGQAARLGWTFRWERATRGRGLPPIGDELRSTTYMWDALRQDVGFGFRMLRRQPGFATVAILALALGIGANTAIFSVVDAVLWRSLPYPGADEIVSIGEQRPREGRLYGSVSPADFFDWRRDGGSFAAMAAYDETAVNLTGTGEPERLRGLSVSPAFLQVLGIQPALGRDIRAEEETVGRHRVALLTDAFWRRRFGADAAIVGRTLSFDGNPYEVIGILPGSFWWPTRPDMLVPLALDDADRALRAAHFLDVVARRRPGISFAQAREEMSLIGGRLSRTYPAENTGHGPNLRPLREALVGDMRTALLMLLSAVGLVLLIACANVATLLLARATSRQKELAVRMAVGGARVRLVQQMLTESLVLALAGGCAGLLLAAWGMAGLRQVLPAQFAALPGIDHLGIDLRVLVASLAVSLLTGVIFGVAPALVASDQRVGALLNEETRGGSGGAKGRQMRSTLVVAELALSLVLLVGAGLLMVSFRNLTDISPGFRPQQLVTTRLTLPAGRYADRARAVAFYEAVFERLRAVPGVDRVAATSAPPFSGLDGRLNLQIEHRTVQSTLPVRAHPRIISTDYFATMGMPLLRGRAFTDRDNEDARDVVIINEAAVRRYWPAADPIGDRISLGDPPRWMEIVGVVGDIRHEGLDAEANPEAYVPYRQPFTALGNGLVRGMTLIIRTSSDVATMAPAVRMAVSSVDDQQPTGLMRPMDALIGDSIAPRRLNFVLVSAFAVVALVLTATGLYGVMAYVVAQRTREIGVRMALGASRRQVLEMMFRQAGAMTAVGIGLGVAGALLLTRSMRSLLFGVSAADPMVYLGVSALLAAVAIVAVAVPSSRATRIDPLLALRDS
jgi:putative ABC transport system permease protein